MMLFLAELPPTGIILFFVVIFLFFIAQIMVMRWYKISKLDHCIIRTGVGSKKAAFDMGTVIVPRIHRYEEVPIFIRHFKIVTTVKFKDRVTKEVESWYCVKVQKTARSVIEAVSNLGLDKIKSESELKKVFEDQFSVAVKTAAAAMDSTKINASLFEFLDKVLNEIGTDLNGLSLEDAALKVK